MPKKVLIVDDEPDGVSFVSSILEENGYDYITAANGAKGLEILIKEKPDLILLDLLMPEKSGIMLFQEVKKDPELRDIPIIIVSGASEVTGVDFKNFIFRKAVDSDEKTSGPPAQAEFFSPDAFVDKPVNPDLLIKAIEKVFKE